MSRDRICRLTPDGHPTPDELREAAIRYLGGAGPLEDGPYGDGFCCLLAGGVSHVFRAVPLHPGMRREFDVNYCAKFADRPFINVVTRQADEFTTAVADGFFAAVCCRWNLEREEI